MKGKTDRDAASEDLQLLALLVAKLLRQEESLDEAPGAGDYRLAESKAFVRTGWEVQVDVDIGRGLKVVVFDVWWDRDGEADLDTLQRTASGIAGKVAETVRERDAVRAMFAEVKAAARREVAKARRRGLPYELTSITLPPLEASQHDQAVIRVEHLAFGQSLQLETFAFHAEAAEDVVQAFSELAEEQRRRTDRRARLDWVGATGTIDSVVVAAIGAAGLDLRHVLTALRDTEDWIVDVEVGDGKRFVLHWDQGAVRGQIQLGEGISWHRGRLSFGKSARTLRKLPKRSPVNRLLAHPFLDDGILVAGDYKTKGEHLSVRCTETMPYFDADSGRVWVQ